MNLKKSIITGCLAFSSIVNAQHTDLINSNRPGESMTAFSVGKNVIQMESGIYHIQEKNKISETQTKGYGLDLTLRYGFMFEELELLLNTQYQFDNFKSNQFNYEENRSGFKSLYLGAKYLVYDPFKNYKEEVNLYSWKANQKFKWKKLLPAVSAYAGVGFNIGDTYFMPDEGTIAPKVMVITQQHLTRQMVFVTNWYADKIASDYMRLGYIATITVGFNEKWSAFIENKGFTSDYHKDNIFGLGAAYLLKENMQIDASINKSIKNNPDLLYGGIGFSWRFDERHTPVKLETEEDGADKRAGKKKDKNKRKDEFNLDQE